MFSYWEKESFLHVDFIVVGGGITGLSTALSIKEKKPDAEVLVLERGHLPTGASTKNAGFACIGSLTEILDDLTNMQESEVLSLVELRLKGLELLRQRLGDNNIDYRENGSYELISESEEYALDKLQQTNHLLHPLLGGLAFGMADEELPKLGFSKSYVKHLVKNNFEGELNSGKMMRKLIQLCGAKGIQIRTGSLVESVAEKDNSIELCVQDYAMRQSITLMAKQIAVCTNAFTRTLLPDLEINPGRGQVIITKPIDNIPFQGIFHFDRGFYYFREINGRILFGGGRNLDFNAESTTTFETTPNIINELKIKLETIILPHKKAEIDYSWAGIMAFGSGKFPILRRISKYIVVGARMGGMGVAIGSKAGDTIAEMLLE